MRSLQHDMLVLSATSSSTGTACIESKADLLVKIPRQGAPLSNKHVTPVLTQALKTPLKTQNYVLALKQANQNCQAQR